jgi:hypothetical protein
LQRWWTASSVQLHYSDVEKCSKIHRLYCWWYALCCLRQWYSAFSSLPTLCSVLLDGGGLWNQFHGKTMISIQLYNFLLCYVSTRPWPDYFWCLLTVNKWTNCSNLLIYSKFQLTVRAWINLCHFCYGLVGKNIFQPTSNYLIMKEWYRYNLQ